VYTVTGGGGGDTHEGKRSLGKPTCKRDDINMYFQEVRCGGIDWIELAQDRDRWRGACECSNKHSGSKKRGESLD
jgi:hypothetical protein